MGSRYVQVVFRTFIDPNDPADSGLRPVTNGTGRDQGGSSPTRANSKPPGDQDQRGEASRGTAANGSIRPRQPQDVWRQAGDVESKNTTSLLEQREGSSSNRRAGCTFISMSIQRKNDGDTPYSLDRQRRAGRRLLVDHRLQPAKGFYEAPENADSRVNNVTAKKDADGAVTVHFGGDPSQANSLPIMPGWNYTVRLYRPKAEILEDKWVFPDASIRRSQARIRRF